MDILLRDHTTQRNIFWATNDYEQWEVFYVFGARTHSDSVSLRYFAKAEETAKAKYERLKKLVEFYNV